MRLQVPDLCTSPTWALRTTVLCVSYLEPGGSPPSCSLPDLSSLSVGAEPSVTVGCCHLAGAQISPRGVEHGFGLLSGQIKGRLQSLGERFGLTNKHLQHAPPLPQSPLSAVHLPMTLCCTLKAARGRGTTPKQLPCAVEGVGKVRRLEPARQGWLEAEAR